MRSRRSFAAKRLVADRPHQTIGHKNHKMTQKLTPDPLNREGSENEKKRGSAELGAPLFLGVFVVEIKMSTLFTVAGISAP